MRTAGTPRDHLLPGRRASSGRWSRRAAGRPRRRCTPPRVSRRPFFRTVTRGPVLSSVMVSCRAVRSPRRRGSLTFIGSRSQSGHPPGARPTTPSGSDPSRAERRHTRHRWPDRRSLQPSTSRHDTPSGLAVALRRTTGLPLPGAAALGQANRSEEIARHRHQPVAAGPGHHQAERDGDVQDRRRPDPSGRVRPGAARGQAIRRLQVPAPHLTKLGHHAEGGGAPAAGKPAIYPAGWGCSPSAPCSHWCCAPATCASPPASTARSASNRT